MIAGMPLAANSFSCARIWSGSRSPFRNQKGRMPYSRGGVWKWCSVTGTAGHRALLRVDICLVPLDDDGGLDEPGRLFDCDPEGLPDLIQREAVGDELVDLEAARAEQPHARAHAAHDGGDLAEVRVDQAQRLP